MVKISKDMTYHLRHRQTGDDGWLRIRDLARKCRTSEEVIRATWLALKCCQFDCKDKEDFA